VGDVALTLGPPIVQPASAAESASPPEGAADAELRNLETPLISSGGDPTMFPSRVEGGKDVEGNVAVICDVAGLDIAMCETCVRAAMASLTA
jgi:hypothetical protein